MPRLTLFLLLLLSFTGLRAQDKNCQGFTKDTLTLPNGTHVEAELMQTTTKNGSQIQLFAIERSRYFIRIYITENFYFGKTDMLTVESGKWTYPVKNCTQYKVSKTMGAYLFE